MQELKLKLTGTVPLMMHNNRAVDPFNEYHLFMKPLSSKRNKTEADLRDLERVEWEAGLYISPKGKICIPGRNIIKAFILGARKSKNGKKFEEGVYLFEDYCDLEFKDILTVIGEEVPNQSLNKIYMANHVDRRPVSISKKTIIRARPIFEEWGLSCTVLFDENVLNSQTVIECAKIAGQYVGLCEMRPRLGRFEVEKV